MPLLALFKERRPQVGGLFLDASLREGHNYSANIATAPIGTEEDVPDHIELLPYKCQLTAILTPHPAPETRSLLERSLRAGGLAGAAAIAATNQRGPVAIQRSLQAGAAYAAVAAAVAQNQSENENSYKRRFAEFVTLMVNKELVTIVTSVATHPRMYPRRISGTKDARDIITVVVDLQQFQISRTRSVDLLNDAASDIGADDANLGAVGFG